MGDLLRQLGRESLPKTVVDEFVQWCVWQQARQSLVLVLEEAKLGDIAAGIQSSQDLPTVTQLGQQAKKHIEALDHSQNQLILSAAEGAVFEFVNLTRSADAATFDAESVSFFAARVCGWAGWAITGFNSAGEKSDSEEAALQAQEAQLEIFLKAYQSKQPDDPGNAQEG